MRMITCLCLFAYSGVQHILCCVFLFCLSSFCVFVYPILPVSQDCPFLFVRSIFSYVYCSKGKDILPLVEKELLPFRCSVLQIIGHYAFWGRRGLVVVMVWQLDDLLPMQLVPITTNVVSSNAAQARCTRYNNM